MIKKLTLLAMAIGALVAFAVPAMASADVRLTDALGTVEVPSDITGTSGNAQTVTANGTLVCEEVHVTATVTTNTEATVFASGKSATANKCKVLQTGTPVVITPTLENIHITTGGTKTASFKFVAHIGGVGGPKCEYGGTVPVSYTSGSSSLHAEGTLTGSSGVAPCNLTAAFSGDFALSNENGAVELM
jgi:hypothetical protein